MNGSSDKILVQLCLREIEEKLGWGSSEFWHNDVFSELSDVVQESTGVLLSPVTLKRVWGKVSYQGMPSITTLNTLSQFAGYKNWRAYKSLSNHSNKPIRKRSFSFRFVSPILLLLFGFMLLASFFWYSQNRKSSPTQNDYSFIEFDSRPVTKGLPNSVVFNFDLGSNQVDSLTIQQSWDPKKTISTSPNLKEATGIYYYPGYFRSKLLLDGTIAKEHGLLIPSEGWMATVDYKPVPKYYWEEEFADSGTSLSEALKTEVKTSDRPLGTTYHFIKDFNGVSCDSLIVKTGIRNVYRDKWAVCQLTNITILGTSGIVTIPFSIPGCVSDLNLVINDTYFDGKENDLSAFGVDFSDYKNIKIEIAKQQVIVFIDSVEVYRGSYSNSLGELVGMRCWFLGASEIEYLTIQNSRDEYLFIGEFNKKDAGNYNL